MTTQATTQATNQATDQAVKGEYVKSRMQACADSVAASRLAVDAHRDASTESSILHTDIISAMRTAIINVLAAERLKAKYEKAVANTKILSLESIYVEQDQLDAAHAAYDEAKKQQKSALREYLSACSTATATLAYTERMASAGKSVYHKTYDTAHDVITTGEIYDESIKYLEAIEYI